jgi:hypothetical protein
VDPRRRQDGTRTRPYGSLDVEDLGRVYEALLELEPGIATEPMCRLRRNKLEVVLPAAQGEKYRSQDSGVRNQGSGVRKDSGFGNQESGGGKGPGLRNQESGSRSPESRILIPDSSPPESRIPIPESFPSDDTDDEETDAPGKRASVQWIEDIPAGRFFLRVGLGRKASGSYYTPHAFVRFLVQETLRPQVEERSPKEDPHPAKILKLKVLDPAMGSGHFLVEACRFLGDALYEACRLCDERALEAEAKADRAGDEGKRAEQLALAAELRGRVEELPDPEDELVAYLPSRVPEGEESGLSQRKAEALCRRLIAVHCLYGVDKNPLAVELAKLSLWLESYAEGLPLTFLNHRLVRGDSITGPFAEHLTTWPRAGTPIEGLFVQQLSARLGERFREALARVGELERTIGTDVADVEQKRAAKDRLDASLAPFRLLAAAWSGGVMLGEEASDADYEALAKAVADGASPEPVIAARPALRTMIDTGADGLPYDLAFPEVFCPAVGIRSPDSGFREISGHQPLTPDSCRLGFDAVLGNPPWDALQPLAKEFFAAFDLRVLDAATRKEREAVETRLTADPRVKEAYEQYVREFESAKFLFDRTYRHVGLQAQGRSSGAVTDLWQVFAERGMTLLRDRGLVGWVLPSAFHANQSATGIRELYLKQGALRCCYSFENKRKLFDIHASFKFATVVAQRDLRGTTEFPCAFYLHDIDWLFQPQEPLRYSFDFVRKTGGDYYSFLELRDPIDAAVAERLYDGAEPLGAVLDHLGIRCGEELHMSKSAFRFTAALDVLPANADPRDPEVARELLARGYLTLHEGKTFHQFDDRWGERPRYLVHLDQLADKPTWREAARYYRLAFRDIARSTDERTGIFTVLPPLVVFGNTAPCERNASARANSQVLRLQGMLDSHAFDWGLRQKSAAHVNLFILNGCPVPKLGGTVSRFLAHAALRLVCNHAGYATLWCEQLGDAWREPTVPHTWPVLAGDDARWALRAAIDAVVARAYGLEREQYAHVLASFSHKSYPAAPERCLAAFDELAAIGLDEFVRRHDPYHDIPLVETLPQPVIDLAVPGDPLQNETFALTPPPTGRRGRHRKRRVS